jgi:hypothetical protein
VTNEELGAYVKAFVDAQEAKTRAAALVQQVREAAESLERSQWQQPPTHQRSGSVRVVSQSTPADPVAVMPAGIEVRKAVRTFHEAVQKLHDIRGRIRTTDGSAADALTDPNTLIDEK